MPGRRQSPAARSSSTATSRPRRARPTAGPAPRSAARHHRRRRPPRRRRDAGARRRRQHARHAPIAGDLALARGSRLDYSFGEANVVGGSLNDLTDVAGDLTLDGTLDVTATPGGSFAPGIYRVIRYGGTLTDDGLALGTVPGPGFFVQTSVAHQVNLVNTAGLTLTFWDGAAGPKDDGAVAGGDGRWQAAAGNDNWTELTGAINAPWDDGAFAIFGGAAGTVTVDGGVGAVAASGMQFTTDGYRLEGDALTLAGTPDAIVRVGDGTAAGAGVTATVAAALTGDARLVKTDLGTLVLSGANSYAGGTAIDGGTVEIAGDAALGAADAALSLDRGTLRTTAEPDAARGRPRSGPAAAP